MSEKSHRWTYRERRAAWSRIRLSLASRGALRRLPAAVRDEYLANVEALTKGDTDRLARWFPIGKLSAAKVRIIDRQVAGGVA